MKNTKTNVFLAGGFLLVFFLPCMVSYAEMMDVVIDGGGGGGGSGGEMQVVSGPSKTLGYDYPNAIVRGESTISVGGSWSAVQGDINGNGVPDLIFTGRVKQSTSQTKRAVGIFFDATLSSLNNRNFSNPDFIIRTQKKFPWASDVMKFHPIHWITVADINRDSFDDIIFSLPIIDLGGGLRDEKGEVYIVFGNTRQNLGSVWDFSTKAPNVTLVGRDAGDRAGFSVASGDINGDGKKDLLIGAPQADGPNNAFTNGGEIYGFTRASWSQSSITLSESNVDLYIYGEANQKYGYAVTSGNLNGDINTVTGRPIDDIIVAPYISPGGPVRVIFGTPTIGGSKRLSLNSNWTSAYNIIPRHPNLAVGDLNRDGINDLVASDAADRDFITYGSTTSISTSANTTINRKTAGDLLGFSNFIADFDGDGFKDLASLAPRETNGTYTVYIPVGNAYIIWGQSARLPSVINLATEPTHFTLYGSRGDGPTGLKSSFQGPWNSTYGYTFGMDLDNDGRSELFFGDPNNTYIYKIDPRTQTTAE